MDQLKMYVLVKQDIPTGIAIVSAVHAPLIAYLKYKDDPIFQQWLNHSFRKVVCWVTPNEFESCKNMDQSIVVTESNYDNKETAIVLCPREEWPRKFKYFPLVGSPIWNKRCGKTKEFNTREQELEYGIREIIKTIKLRLEHAKITPGAKEAYIAGLDEACVFAEAEANRWINRTFNQGTTATEKI